MNGRQYTVGLINPTFKCFLLDCLSYLMRDALPPLVTAFLQKAKTTNCMFFNLTVKITQKLNYSSAMSFSLSLKPETWLAECRYGLKYAQFNWWVIFLPI